MANVAAVVPPCLRPAAMELGPASSAAAATTAVVRPQLALRRLLLRCAPAAASVAAHRGQMMILGLTLSPLFQVHLRRQGLLQLRQPLLPRLPRNRRHVRAALSAVARTLPARVPRRHWMVVYLCLLHLLPNLDLRLLPTLPACRLCLLAALLCFALTPVDSAWILLPILPA